MKGTLITIIEKESDLTDADAIEKIVEALVTKMTDEQNDRGHRLAWPYRFKDFLFKAQAKPTEDECLQIGKNLSTAGRIALGLPEYTVDVEEKKAEERDRKKAEAAEAQRKERDRKKAEAAEARKKRQTQTQTQKKEPTVDTNKKRGRGGNGDMSPEGIAAVVAATMSALNSNTDAGADSRSVSEGGSSTNILQLGGTGDTVTVKPSSDFRVSGRIRLGKNAGNRGYMRFRGSAAELDEVQQLAEMIEDQLADVDDTPKVTNPTPAEPDIFRKVAEQLLLEKLTAAPVVDPDPAPAVVQDEAPTKKKWGWLPWAIIGGILLSTIIGGTIWYNAKDSDNKKAASTLTDAKALVANATPAPVATPPVAAPFREAADKLLMEKLTAASTCCNPTVGTSCTNPCVPTPVVAPVPATRGCGPEKGSQPIPGADGFLYRRMVCPDGTTFEEKTPMHKGPEGPEGPQGIPGTSGDNCWDNNPTNGRKDLATEDWNDDGVVDVYDCMGPAGPQGEAAPRRRRSTRRADKLDDKLDDKPDRKYKMRHNCVMSSYLVAMPGDKHQCKATEAEALTLCRNGGTGRYMPPGVYKHWGHMCK